MFKISSTIFFLIVITITDFYAQGNGGKVFQEYIWTTPSGAQNSPFIRVGGRLDYKLAPDLYPDMRIHDGEIEFPFDIKLRGAICAELIAEKLMCHGGTRNLRISFNGRKELVFPESEFIPEPQENYMYHFFPSLNVPMDYLKEGKGNTFTMAVDTAHPWNWPQNLIYGLVLRVYYEEDNDQVYFMPSVKQLDDTLVSCSLTDCKLESICKVEYLAFYDGIDTDGDGNYKDWQYRFFRGKLQGHIGTVEEAPWTMDWNIGWIPDQAESIKIAARVHNSDGKIYFTEPVELDLSRTGYSVELCKPYDIPQEWVTRNDTYREKIFVKGNPGKLTDARIVFSSWSPGYLNGIYLNDFLVSMREGKPYEYMRHLIPLKELDWFHPGENEISTGKTPLHHGSMVHGCEIMYPGIMVLLKYERP